MAAAPSAPNAAPADAQRFAVVDALRGAALLWMTVFHLCFDLQHFGYLQADFYRDPFWLLQRTAIVSLFLLCAGLGQSVAVAQGQSWQRFGRRWLRIAGCALLVSAGSYLVYPQSFIYFGILHGMALMLLLVRALAPSMLERGWLAIAALALALPPLAAQAHAHWPLALDWLNAPRANWLGLIGRKPVTEDYAPLLPWLGVMCLGMALGQWALRQHHSAVLRASRWCVQGPLAVLLRPLARWGQWSLSYYMLHQPVLFGALLLYRWAQPAA